MNKKDAERLGIKDYDVVKIVSASNPEGVWDLMNGEKIEIKGSVKVIQGIRPGTIAVSWSYGHWAYGANDIIVNGKKIKGDPRRKTGLCANALLAVDPVLKNTCLEDMIGGSSSFFDTKVKVIKI
jgi:anaerobic selenocysteine-containing dehydrogenase